VYPNYAELVVNLKSFEEVAPFAKAFEAWAQANVPGAIVRTRIS
jgi:hypothetical protein